MRRRDREVRDFDGIVDILERANTMRLGLFNGLYPYVVPLSYGFEATRVKSGHGGEIDLFFHGALQGLKHDLVAANPHVCAEVSIFHRYAETPGGITTEYESVIGFGEASQVTGEPAEKGLELLLRHCGFDSMQCDARELAATAVYRVHLESFTGKRRFVGDAACPIPLGKYRDYEGGLYEATGVVTDSDTQGEVVVYRQLFGAGKVLVKPLALWNEFIQVGGKLVRRFEFLGSDHEV